MPEALAPWAAGWVQLVAVLSLFGTLLFQAAVAPAALRRDPHGVMRAGRLRVLTGASFGLAFLSLLWWFAAESAAIAGAEDWPDLAGSLPPVLLHTQLGEMAMLRAGLLLAALAAWMWPSGRGGTGWAQRVAALLAGGAVGVQALIGHGAAMGGRMGALLAGAETVHILAAGAWLGGLLPLLLLVRGAPVSCAAEASRRFSPIGLTCVLLIGLTAAVLGAVLVGGIPALLRTGYGRVVQVKLALLAGLLVCAALNRLVLVPRLADSRGARRGLACSIAAEAALGLAILFAASRLAAMMPPADMGPMRHGAAPATPAGGTGAEAA